MLGKLIGGIAVVALTIAPAIIQGNYLNRWGTPPDLTNAADRLDALPKKIGGFEYAADGDPLSDPVCKELGLAGYLTRVYVKPETGEKLALLLMVGQPGRLVRHPPNICYSSRGMQLGGMQALEGVGDNGASQFNVLRYQQPGLGNNQFSVAFSHTVDGDWSAPKSPRLAFGGEPLLYKVQVLMGNEQSTLRSHETLRQFLDDFTRTFRESVTHGA